MGEWGLGSALQEPSAATAAAESALGTEPEPSAGAMKRVKSRLVIANRACRFAKSCVLLQRGAREEALPLPPRPQVAAIAPGLN